VIFATVGAVGHLIVMARLSPAVVANGWFIIMTAPPVAINIAKAAAPTLFLIVSVLVVMVVVEVFVVAVVVAAPASSAPAALVALQADHTVALTEK